MSKYEVPNSTPFGIALITNLRDDGIYEILGGNGNGFMIHKDLAPSMLTPQAISHGETFDDYLTYPQKTTGNIIVMELGGKTGFIDYKKNDLRKAIMYVAENYPDYVKERGIGQDSPKKKQIKAKDNPEPERG